MKKIIDAKREERKRMSMVRLLALCVAAELVHFCVENAGYISWIWQRSTAIRSYTVNAANMKRYPMVALRIEKKTATPGGN